MAGLRWRVALSLLALTSALAAGTFVTGYRPTALFAQAAPVVVRIDPSPLVAEVGTTTDASVWVGTGVESLYGIEVELGYDSRVIEVVSIAAGSSLRGNGVEGSAGRFFQDVQIDNPAGSASLMVTLLNPAAPPVFPDRLVHMVLRCKSAGMTGLQLTTLILSDIDGVEIASQAQSGSVLCQTGAGGPTVVTTTVPLAAGFNLVGIPLQFPATTTAKDVAQQIAAQGGAVAAILRWDSGYEEWLAEFPDEKNFVMEAGRGYFVRVETTPANGSWTVEGFPFTNSVPIDLEVGFNLIAVPFATPAQGYDAKTLAEAIDASGAVASVLRWNAGYEAWLADFGDEKKFSIDASSGYFVRISQAVVGFSP